MHTVIVRAIQDMMDTVIMRAIPDAHSDCGPVSQLMCTRSQMHSDWAAELLVNVPTSTSSPTDITGLAT